MRMGRQAGRQAVVVDVVRERSSKKQVFQTGTVNVHAAQRPNTDTSALTCTTPPRHHPPALDVCRQYLTHGAARQL